MVLEWSLGRDALPDGSEGVMTRVECLVLALTLLLAGCGSSSTNPMFGAPGSGGSGSSAGAAGAAGSGSEAGATTTMDAGDDAPNSCPAHMRLGSGAFCIDVQPALLSDGSQGVAVDWISATETCATRGLRLCNQDEREGSCPDGISASNTGANGEFCTGPAETWEWGGDVDVCASGQRRRSPCCNTGYSPTYTTCANESTLLSFHCCRSI